MTTRQKIGLATVSGSLLATLILQAVFSALYSPEAIHDIQIVPAPPDLTAVLFFLATDWTFVFPLICAFGIGLFCLLVPERHPEDHPEMIEIHYLS